MNDQNGWCSRLARGLFVAALALCGNAMAEEEYLDVEQAFQLKASLKDAKTVALSWTIAPGYKLYRERLVLAVEGNSAQLAAPVLPAGQRKFDAGMNKEMETYHNKLVVTAAVMRASGPFVLLLSYQGCADAGLCYPPVEGRYRVDPAKPGALVLMGENESLPPVAPAAAAAGKATVTSAGTATVASVGSTTVAAVGTATVVATAPAAAMSGTPPASAVAGVAPAAVPVAASAAPVSSTAPEPSASASSASPAPADDDGSLAQKTLQSGSIWRIGMAFFVFGLLLSFTPCVLPMIPILSSIIVGEGNVTRSRGFLLALAYCMGMALIYTAMGVAAGLAGASLAAALQQPAVLISFALVLFVLSLSMFDVFQLQLPSALQSRLSDTSNRMGGGRFAGVFVMGALSALIVGPCVAAPLAGALLYISQTGNVFTGGWALFAMAMGMSVPLLLTGVSAGSLLPRAGGWMNSVKRVFGLLLIATSIWMVFPILPAWGAMVAVGAYAILCAVYLHVFDTVHEHSKQGMTGQRFGKALGVVFLLVGVFELLGAASGGDSVLQPLGHLRVGSATAAPLAKAGAQFKRIRTIDELDQELAASTKPVMLDFYADWCVSCKEMEHFTFTDKQVAERMAQFTLLQIDVTANNAADKAMMKKFSLFGPPAIILYDKNDQEARAQRVIGFMSSESFGRRLDATLKH